MTYMAAVKGFTRWLATHHKLPRDSLASVKKPSPKTDRRHDRRMLLPGEWRYLEAVTADGHERCGMTGTERAILYRAAIETGLRSSELESLTRGRLYLDVSPPYVTCKAGNTKDSKDARQYIQPELAAELKALIATKAPKAPVFNLPHKSNMARMLRDDLADARQQWITDAISTPQEYANREQSDFLPAVNHEGEVMDFHALRHTCGAWLAKTGAHPKTVQTVMRHSTITLTMDTYGHLFPGQEADAIGQMRHMLTDQPTALLATGTDDIAAGAGRGRAAHMQRAGRETAQSDANGCDVEREDIAKAETHKPLQIADLCDVVQDNAPESDSAPSRTRTLNLLIKSPNV